MKIRSAILSTLLAAAIALTATGCKKSGTQGNVGEITPQAGDIIAEIVIEDFGTIKAVLFPDIAPNAVNNFKQLAEQGYYNGLKIHRVAPDFMIQGGSLNGDGTGGKALISESGVFSVETNALARNFYGALGYANVDGYNSTQFYIVNNKTPIDITQYDPAKIKAEASRLGEEIAKQEPESDVARQLSAQQSHYNALATMLEKASDEVKAKYNKVGGIPFWDGGYTVFGQVIEGYNVLDEISKVELTVDNNSEHTRPVKDIIITSVTVREYDSSADSDKGKKPSKTTASSDDAATSDASAEGTGESDTDNENSAPASDGEADSAEGEDVEEAPFDTEEEGE